MAGRAAQTTASAAARLTVTTSLTPVRDGAACSTMEVLRVSSSAVVARRRPAAAAAATAPPVYLVVLPGNPGIVEPYAAYVSALVRASGGAVAGGLVLGHSGHSSATATRAHPPWTLAQQLAHKRDALLTLLAAEPGARLVLAGHSVGAWMVVELLREPAIRRAVLRCLLLFPTLSHIGESRNGVRLAPVFRHLRGAAWLLMAGIAALPSSLLTLALRVLASPQDDAALASLRPVVHPDAIVSAFTMAMHEMDEIGALDEAHVGAHAHLLAAYFAAEDDWVSTTDAAAMAARFPAATVVSCAEGHRHAFVLSSDGAARMGELSWGLVADAVGRAGGASTAQPAPPPPPPPARAVAATGRQQRQPRPRSRSRGGRGR